MSEHSLEDILRLGERLYFDKFRQELEAEFDGQHAVIDVDRSEYVVKSNPVEAMDEAKKKFGDKVFYVIQVGRIDHPTSNHFERRYAWPF